MPLKRKGGEREREGRERGKRETERQREREAERERRNTVKLHRREQWQTCGCF